MSYHKTYFQKNNTIINKQTANTSQNEVFELVYGNLINNFFENVSTGNTIFSRYIFQLDLTSLVNKYLQEGTALELFKTHKIKIFNTINLSNTRIGEMISNSVFRGFDKKIYLYELDIDDFTEGTGREYVYNNVLQKNVNHDKPSNWFYKSENQLWDKEGVLNECQSAYYSGTTGESYLCISGESSYYTSLPDFVDYRFYRQNPIGEFYLEYGNENLEYDISDLVNTIISGYTIDNNVPLKRNFMLAYSHETEIDPHDDNLFKIHFFSKYTQTYFEPYLESYIEDEIIDDRHNFILGKKNNLYFYMKDYFDAKKMEDIILQRMELLDECRSVIGSSVNLTKVKNGIFTIRFQVDNVEPYTKMYDSWVMVGMNPIVHDFTLLPYKREKNSNEYFVFLSNVYNFEKLKRGEKRKINVSIRKLKNDYINPNIFYRIYVIESDRYKIEAIPECRINQTTNDGNYFLLDTSIFVPQTYYIETYCKEDDIITSEINTTTISII